MVSHPHSKDWTVTENLACALLCSELLGQHPAGDGDEGAL